MQGRDGSLPGNHVGRRKHSVCHRFLTLVLPEKQVEKEIMRGKPRLRLCLGAFLGCIFSKAEAR
jgi:hypothetical protein